MISGTLCVCVCVCVNYKDNLEFCYISLLIIIFEIIIVTLIRNNYTVPLQVSSRDCKTETLIEEKSTLIDISVLREYFKINEAKEFIETYKCDVERFCKEVSARLFNNGVAFSDNNHFNIDG